MTYIVRTGFVCFLLLIMTVGCQKAEERTCFKGAGEYSELEIPLDSIRHFQLNKGIKYRFFQDDQRKMIIKGGKHLISRVDVDNRDNVLYVNNENRCDFLRNSEAPVEVEIHYPHLRSFFFNATDSVIFEGKIFEYSLLVEMRDGGGSLSAFVDVTKLIMVVSRGAGDITLKGVADEAELKVQNNGAMNAIGFRSEYVFMYQNSTADMFINLDGSSALIVVDGTGNVYYENKAGNIEQEGLGSGQIIQL